MEKVLAAIGAFPESHWQAVAKSLYETGHFEDDRHVVSLLSIGRRPDKTLRNQFALVPQITFDHILRFVHGRLVKYLNVKAQHEQWDRDGKALWDAADRNRGVEDFVRAVSVETGATSD